MTIVTVLTAAGLVAVAAASVLPPRGETDPSSDQTASSKQPVFVCRLDGLTSDERKQQRELRATLERATAQVTEDAEGYTFHYTTAVAPSTVMAWVEMERKCCPFLRFTLDMAEEGGPARLRVWGVPGVKAFVATEMQIDK
ncbi:MAG: hypothetical protein GEV06_17825 [Luteitalea sp.]|nr:hypothetical protein [Luteitalea sp.]